MGKLRCIDYRCKRIAHFSSVIVFILGLSFLVLALLFDNITLTHSLGYKVGQYSISYAIIVEVVVAVLVFYYGWKTDNFDLLIIFGFAMILLWVIGTPLLFGGS